MPFTIARGILLLGLVPLLGACELVGDCAADDPPQKLNPGSYSVALQDASGAGGSIEQLPGTSFPHDGRSVSVEVDRDAGVVYARWTNDEGQPVVETWRMEAW